MRECGDCKECCIWLYQESYGHTSGNGKPCGFLCDFGCSIYEKRPSTCSYYECAWKQGLFPDWMKPDECGIIISINNLPTGEQFLNITETDVPLQSYIIKELEKFSKENGCGIKYVNKETKQLKVFGSESFVNYFISSEENP